MISDRTRTEIWQGLWDAKRMVRYYEQMHERYRKRNLMTMLLLVTLGTSALATLWEKMPAEFQPIAGVLVAAVSLWILLADYAAKAATALSIAHRCGDLAADWADLFAYVDGEDEEPDEAKARATLHALKQRLRDATYASGHARLTDSDKINEKASEDAATEMEQSYA